MKKKILVIGSINYDLVVFTPRHPAPGETIIGSRFQTFPGGKGANQAVAAARLGGNVQIIGNIGQDGFGEELLENLCINQVDTTCIKRVNDSSGTALITVNADGQNSIVVVPGANATLGKEDIEGLRDTITIRSGFSGAIGDSAGGCHAGNRYCLYSWINYFAQSSTSHVITSRNFAESHLSYSQRE